MTTELHAFLLSRSSFLALFLRFQRESASAQLLYTRCIVALSAVPRRSLFPSCIKDVSYTGGQHSDRSLFFFFSFLSPISLTCPSCELFRLSMKRFHHSVKAVGGRVVKRGRWTPFCFLPYLSFGKRSCFTRVRCDSPRRIVIAGVVDSFFPFLFYFRMRRCEKMCVCVCVSLLSPFRCLSSAPALISAPPFFCVCSNPANFALPTVCVVSFLLFAFLFVPVHTSPLCACALPPFCFFVFTFSKRFHLCVLFSICFSFFSSLPSHFFVVVVCECVG